ncbi:MAG: WbqC family protein [Pseudomonadota bacterium]|nr:WbqC family protein [Pseudomonadota bacterium]
MKVAIIQSNYIPWKGYFDIIHDVDLFIFYDEVQFTKNDWRNRNKVKSNQGVSWITVPVGKSISRYLTEVEIKEKKWQNKHYKIFKQNYIKSNFYKKYIEFLEHIYLEQQWNNLSELNQYVIKLISKDFLGIKTKFKNSFEYQVTHMEKQEKIMGLLQKAKASTYVSGPAARSYIAENAFQQAGIELIWKDYSNYPEYPQFFPPFKHGVTILDLLFHTGPDAPYYIWGWREENR